jgi:hypothetical protein
VRPMGVGEKGVASVVYCWAPDHAHRRTNAALLVAAYTVRRTTHRVEEKGVWWGGWWHIYGGVCGECMENSRGPGLLCLILILPHDVTHTNAGCSCSSMAALPWRPMRPF